MKTEPWGSHGGRRVARSASMRPLPFRFCIFAMLAAVLPLVAFAHSASAQTNTPAPGAPAAACDCTPSRHSGAGAGNDARQPVPQSVAARCRSGHNGRQSIDAPRCDARATRRCRAGGDTAPPSPPANTAAPGADTGPANAPAPAPTRRAPTRRCPLPRHPRARPRSAPRSCRRISPRGACSSMPTSS